MRSYSIVVPLHNEEENVSALYARLKQVLEQIGGLFELLLVDDGSTDRTYQLLKEIAAVDSRVLVVKLRRNFGQAAALAAGFDHASGEFILAMDGDLQHDPNDIPKFLKKLEEGYDIVSGWRKDRIDNLILRRIPPRCVNWLMAWLSGVDIHDFGTTFKAYRRQVIQSVPLYGEMHWFIPALASWYGASICEIPARNINRKRAIATAKSGAPSGCSSIFSAILFAMKVLNSQLDTTSLHAPMFVIAAVLILSGVQLLSIGLLGELHVRHYHSVESNAPYTIDRLVRLASSEEQGTLSGEHGTRF